MKLDKNFAALTSLTSIILASAIIFGGNRIWIWSLNSILIFAIFISVTVIEIGKHKRAYKVIHRIKWEAALFILSTSWVTIQIAAKYIFIDEIASINPEKSAIFLSKTLSYGMIFWISINCAKSYNSTIKIIYLISYFSTGIALYSLTLYVFNMETILWFEKTWGIGRVSGTFINPNSYVIFSGIGLTANLMLFIKNMPSKSHRNKGKMREIAKIFSQIDSRIILTASGIILNSSAILLTGSRAGIISVIIGIIALMVFRHGKGGIQKQDIIRIFTTAFISTAIILFFSINTLQTIFSDDQTGLLRFLIYWQILGASDQFALAGSGLGTFDDAFLPYRIPELSWLTWDYAHNTYLELAFDLGLPAAFALLTALGLIVWQCLRGAITRQHHHEPVVLALAISCMVGAHALIDFSIQMPSIAALYTLIIGLGWTHSFSRRHRHA